MGCIIIKCMITSIAKMNANYKYALHGTNRWKLAEKPSSHQQPGRRNLPPNGITQIYLQTGIDDIESLKRENFEWLLRVNELEENIERVEWELEIAQSQKEQAEAKVATLELRGQPGKKEGSKEIRCLLAAEAEKTQAIERLVAEETKRSRQREEKLREMQKRMAAWERKSPEPDLGQMGEQKEVRQRLEVSKNLIAALQEEIRDQAEQIDHV
ncbi:hypothetical protein Y1Q_0019703 [Alligator mississippiensis]|uniref:Uncharacterized protein n=1 Tax=Alligator mississippiensis TaxID=8496 RepID=A0A151PFN8_ALLMI|nr:hypothetical protein Y1Q_0019703 [Alligator mississippiensis]